MSNEIKLKYGPAVQWLDDSGAWNIGHLVTRDGLPVLADSTLIYPLVQPYHGGQPVFVRAFKYRDKPHEETT